MHKLKILFVHTYYKIRGGEDFIFENEVDLLSKEHDVRSVIFRNEGGISGIFQFISSIWNYRNAKKVENELIQFKPDIVHIHNLHFALGPLVIRKIKQLEIPIVMTLHNYRILCPSATLVHDKKIFLNSINADFPLAAVFNKVYRNSYFLTFHLALSTFIHKKMGTWQMVSRYIVLTDFAKQLISSSSLNISANKISVKANSIPETPFVMEGVRNGFLFVGRLSEEKGVELLLNAFKTMPNFKLSIAGEGPLEEIVKAAADKHPNIEYLGVLKRDQVYNQLNSCEALIFPSIWYEGLPTIIIESFMRSTPVISSKIGAMESMIEDGVNGSFFSIGDIESMRRSISKFVLIPSPEKEIMRRNARQTYLSRYTDSVNSVKLTNLYNDVI